jgi:protein FAM50
MDTLSNPPSGTSTPSRFTSQATSAEDVLKYQTVGLVNLADFRKRRADALEQSDRQGQDGGRSGARPPNVEDGDG